MSISRTHPRRDRALKVAQVALLAGGTALLAFYALAQVHGRQGTAQALDAFAVAQNARSAGAAVADRRPLEYADRPDQSLWGTTRIAAYRDSLLRHRDPPLGVLRITAVGIEVPIFDGTGELALNRGAGRIEGTAALDAPGNLGVAGHRDGFFRGLKDVRLDDAIDVQSLEGTVRYRVTELLIVEPTDVYVLEPTPTATLTLVTCYPFYFIGEAPQRYIVKAVAEPAESSP